MPFRWSRVVYGVFSVMAVGVLVYYLPQIVGFLSTIQHIGDRYSTPADRTVGCIALGVVAVLVAVMLRLGVELVRAEAEAYRYRDRYWDDYPRRRRRFGRHHGHGW